MSYPHETNSSFNGDCKAPTNSGEFSSHATPEMLAALRQIAEAEGRQFQVVLDAAVRAYIDWRQKVPSSKARNDVICRQPWGIP